jgi:hypothetical protein
VYEDLEALAQLKFGKEMNAIVERVRQSIQEASSRFASTAGAAIRSGQHDALLGQIRIDGAGQMARMLFELWVELIKQRNGHIAREDIGFIGNKVDQCLNAQRTNLRKMFAEQRGGRASLVQRVDMRMREVSASCRRDLEIMVREYEAFPKTPAEEKESMKQDPKKRFSVGRRVLVGIAMRPATVQSVAEAPSYWASSFMTFW